jgi:hypothetical protein
MLEDFEELKSQLNIVNKAFVTIGKPLRIHDSFVYLRDTMLLAPAGKASLEKLGVLYKEDGDFSKRIVSSEDKAQMGKLLQRDKQAFEEYAIQDAVITLKQALSMEKFNMSINHLGIPLTLTSIRRNYVFNE